MVCHTITKIIGRTGEYTLEIISFFLFNVKKR